MISATITVVMAILTGVCVGLASHNRMWGYAATSACSFLLWLADWMKSEIRKSRL